MGNIQTIMQEMKMDLKGGEVHYFIVGLCMKDNIDKVFSSIHFNNNTVFDIVFESNRLLANVMTDKRKPDDISRIDWPYSKIYTISKANSTSLSRWTMMYSNIDAFNPNAASIEIDI